MKNQILVGLLFLASAVILSANIGGYSLYLLDEVKNAECAREMYETGNWVTPTFNYQLRTDKPPLHYYFMSLAYLMFGVSEFSARIFSVIFGVLTLFITYRFAKIHISGNAAIYTTLVLLSSVGFILQFRMAVPDPYLVFFTTAGLLGFYHGFHSSNHHWLILAYLSIGLAILSKGPVGLLIPFLVILLYVLKFERTNWRKTYPWVATVIILAISLPWFVLVGLETEGEWVKEFFIEHNFARYLSTEEGHGGSVLLTPLFFLLMLMPLGVFLVPAIIWVLKNSNDQLSVYCLVIVSVITLFFSLSSTKLPNYVSPALPFAAIIIGRYFSESKPDLKILIPWLLALLLITGSALTVPAQINSEIILPKDWLLIIGLPLGTFPGMFFIWKERLFVGILSIAMSSVSTIVLLFYSLVPRIDRQNPVQLSMGSIRTAQYLAAYHIFNPSYSFYLKKEIEVFVDRNNLEEYLNQHEGVVVLTRSSVLSDLKRFDLDTLIVAPDLFEKTSSAILIEK